MGGEGSRWWRFNRYEIGGGFIRPASGASLAEFDPWLAYETRGEGHIDIPPYLELVNLVQDLPRDPFGQRIQVSQELENGVLNWCSRFGLLGLLPHEVSSARFGSSLFTRTGAGWIESSYPWESDPYGPPEIEIIREAVWGHLIHESDEFWYEYFPSGDGQKHLPVVPLSKPFWETYAEPLQYFLQVARFFSNAIKVISDPGHQPVVEGERRRSSLSDKVYEKEQRLDLQGAITRLNHLSRSVTPTARINETGEFRREWRSPSMLGYLAMQAVQELLGDRKIIRCAACPNVIASSHHAAKYCSDRCGDRLRKREQRIREKRKKKARSPRRRKKA